MSPLQAPVRYWKSKAREHQDQYLRYGWGFAGGLVLLVTLLALASAIYQLWGLFYTDPNYWVGAIDVIIIVMAIFVLLESQSAFRREKRAAGASSG